GKIPRASLRDKIVLVGINSPSVSDERVTPISYSHKGVEVQSLTILQLLRAALNGEQFLAYAPDWQEDIWMLAWCLLGGVIGFRLRSPWKFAAAIIVSTAFLAWVAQRFFAAGIWIPLAAPMVAFLPAAALVTSYISFQENRNR